MKFSKRDVRFFEMAKDLAMNSNYHDACLGAVISKGNNILSFGMNTSKTHTMQSHYNKYRTYKDGVEPIHCCHAEIMALSHLPKKVLNKMKNGDIKGVSIYIYRKPKNGKVFGMAKPCEACTMALKEHHISNIYYTTNDGYAYEKFIM